MGSAAPQTIPQRVPEDSRLRRAYHQEGEAIVQAAWELRHGLVPKPDCSHFVHAVYAQAGFDYEYAQAAAIFAGIDSFLRGKVPQPHDLALLPSYQGLCSSPLR